MVARQHGRTTTAGPGSSGDAPYQRREKVVDDYYDAERLREAKRLRQATERIHEELKYQGCAAQ